MEHELKCWPSPFSALRAGVKRHEYRLDDRGFSVGDTLVIREWDPGTSTYTGRALVAEVTYISRGPDFGIPEGHAVLSVRLVADLGKVDRP
jgi:hypothetical protein